MRNLGLCQSRSGHFPALDLFRLSLHTALLQSGGSSHPNQALKWTIPIERWSTMSSGFPAPRMAGHFGGGTTVPPVDLLPTVLQCACRIVSGAVPPVVQAADRTVRQAGKPARNPARARNGPSAGASAQPNCQFSVALCELVRMGVYFVNPCGFHGARALRDWQWKVTGDRFRADCTYPACLLQ